MAIEPRPHVSLQAFSGMATPTVAAWLVSATSLAELKQALSFAHNNDLESLVIGEGSNTVFAQDFDGLLIVNRLLGITVVEQDDDQVLLDVAAGENWHQLITHCLAQGWYGLENLALIPGSVGAAPIQNIGAYGVELASCVAAVTYLDRDSHRLVELSAEQCEFAYRDSVFKHALKHKAIISSVRLRLRKHADVTLSYGALQSRFPNRSPSPQQVFDAVCEIRSGKLPLPSEIPNCGSFFKNPIVTAEQHAELRAAYPNLVSYAAEGGFKLAAAWLIEQAGWKDKNMGGVRVHQNQALVITNPDHASGALVIDLATGIQQDIQQRFGVELEFEPTIV